MEGERFAYAWDISGPEGPLVSWVTELQDGEPVGLFYFDGEPKMIIYADHTIRDIELGRQITSDEARFRLEQAGVEITIG